MIQLLRAKLLMLKNRVVRLRGGELVKTLFFAVLGLLFLSALHWTFVRLLRQVQATEIIGGLLMVKLLSMGFLSLFVMVAVSATLTAFSTLFFSKELSMLIHTPLSYRTIFSVKAMETAVYASWMIVLAVSPFFAAYGQVTAKGLGFFAYLILLLIPFVAIAAALGIGLSLGLLCLFPAQRVREVMLVLTLLVATSLFVALRWLGPDRFVRADSLEVIIQYIALLETPNALWLPSTWMTSAVGDYAAGHLAGAWGWVGLVGGAAVLAGAALAAFAERVFYAGWSSAQEGVRRARPTVFGREWRWVPSLFGRPFRAMLGKDILIFFRDANQWSQLLMLGSIVAIYLVSIRKLPVDTPFLKGLISFLNIGVVGFVMSSVALRFVFPTVSLEGRSWWALRASPLGLNAVLAAKFVVGFVPLAAVGVTLVWASNRFLGVDAFVTWLSMGTTLTMAFTLTAMGVGFGALFPLFHVENVARIQTSTGGLLYMVTSMFYVGLTLSLEAVWMRWHYLMALARVDRWDRPLVVSVAAALLVVNALFVVVPLAAGRSRLESVDI